MSTTFTESLSFRQFPLSENNSGGFNYVYHNHWKRIFWEIWYQRLLLLCRSRNIFKNLIKVWFGSNKEYLVMFSAQFRSTTPTLTVNWRQAKTRKNTGLNKPAVQGTDKPNHKDQERPSQSRVCGSWVGLLFTCKSVTSLYNCPIVIILIQKTFLYIGYQHIGPTFKSFCSICLWNKCEIWICCAAWLLRYPNWIKC